MFSSLSLSLLLFVSSAAAGPARVSGTVVDASGRALPRAEVRVVANDSTIFSTFTDADGRFSVPASTEPSCRIEAALTGFAPASAPCGADEPLRLTLTVGPLAENIVVSATRTEAPAGQLAASVTVFDRTDILQRQQPPLADLLRAAPGVQVVRSGAPGGVTSLFVRGGESNYTKVLLDGVPINEPGGVIDLSNLSTWNLDRVELVSGANSALFGSDAMTGVIQLFTARAVANRPAVRVSAEGGSFGTVRASAGVSARAGRFDYTADVGRVSTDNDTPNSDFDGTTVSGTAGAQLSNAATVRFVGRLERSGAGSPGQTAFGRPDLDARFDRRDGVIGATFEQTIGRWRSRASYGLNVSHQTSSNLLLDPPYTPSYQGHTAPFEFDDFAYNSRTLLQRHHATYQSDLTTSSAFGTHVDTALVDWDGERATLKDVLNATSVPASRDNVGVSLQHQALWSRAFVTAGVRFEHNGSFGSAVVPRLAGAYYLHTGTGMIGATRIRASAGGGIKEPTVLQSFSPSPFFRGNPDLEPERARTLDAGIEQRLAADRVRLSATWFANRYRNIISTKTISFDPFVSQYFNIGLTRARGLELAGDVALVSGFKARAGYTFDDSKILESASPSSDVFMAGNSAFRRPRHSGYAQVSWMGARGAIDLTGWLVGSRVDSDFSSLAPALTSNPAYQQWDLRGSLRVTRDLSVTAAIDNVADRAYMEPLGYPALGRAIRIGATFGK